MRPRVPWQTATVSEQFHRLSDCACLHPLGDLDGDDLPVRTSHDGDDMVGFLPEFLNRCSEGNLGTMTMPVLLLVLVSCLRSRMGAMMVALLVT